MDSVEGSERFEDSVPELAVDTTTDKMGEEVVASFSVMVKIVDLAQHYSLDDPAPLYPMPDVAAPRAWTEEGKLDWHQPTAHGWKSSWKRNN